MSNKLIIKVIKRGNHKFVDVDEWEAELEISIQIVDKCRAQLMPSAQLKIMFSAQVLFFFCSAIGQTPHEGNSFE